MAAEKIDTPDGISWYVERTPAQDKSVASTEYIILIPSGEGDCHAFKYVCPLLSEAGHNVLTFDLPGFSRTTAPPEAYDRVTPHLVANQIVTLLDKLDIKQPVVFWGSSSGGSTALALEIYHPERTKCAIIHEVPFSSRDSFNSFQTKPDAEIVAFCKPLFDGFVAHEEPGRQPWIALGPEYHARLEKNWVTWMHHVVNVLEHSTMEMSTPENLQKRPIFWTVGALWGDMCRVVWKDDFDVAAKAGLEVNTTALESLHFPYVTVPEQMRDWILQCIKDVGGK